MRRVVVTGGGTGIGRAIAERFAEDGSSVFILGRRKDVLDRVVEENRERQIRAVACDLTRPDEVLRAADEIADDSVDVLVNNAGGIVKNGTTGLEGVFETYRRTIDANLLSAMMITEALWKSISRPGGRVVNISSIAAHRGGGAYGAAKAGLVGWGFGLAGQGGPDGITVNTVSPGYVQDTEFFNEQGRSARHDRLVAESLVKRAGVPGDIASIVHFLASPEASWITGQVLGVNGGSLLGR
ncbi:SDR family NAD(P)-dependent oxidoreductase [Nocardiopsis sp. HUAS JQ3]|uniref:SDR family NAD(P)-dependent oxidoreductase n=1 Tax=Nocardiopsis sp. HUAS JQ3 TaxID=3061629 RepID=UPI0023A935B6|nr:SDR family oxidoreductase [Nocardiopsis sp. HUAS JQ3]WDZ88825.1 SDR family NAD(P)-dependent oxidoreductase [Nocardiopsis sp. HUAS JQ3]